MKYWIKLVKSWKLFLSSDLWSPGSVFWNSHILKIGKEIFLHKKYLISVFNCLMMNSANCVLYLTNLNPNIISILNKKYTLWNIKIWWSTFYLISINHSQNVLLIYLSNCSIIYIYIIMFSLHTGELVVAN